MALTSGPSAGLRSFLFFLFRRHLWMRATKAPIVVPLRELPRDACSVARPSPERAPSASAQLETLLGKPWPFPGRAPKHDLSTWRVTDDWPDPVPVTLAEVEVFERRFGDLFDEFFSSPL